jgi:hypothetical protein
MLGKNISTKPLGKNCCSAECSLDKSAMKKKTNLVMIDNKMNEIEPSKLLKKTRKY